MLATAFDRLVQGLSCIGIATENTQGIGVGPRLTKFLGWLGLIFTRSESDSVEI